MIFLGPDSNPMTYETWQSSKASMISVGRDKIKTVFKKYRKIIRWPISPCLMI